MSISHREGKPKRGRFKSPDRLEVYPADVKVIRDFGPQPQPEHLKDVRRGQVEMFSARSASRLTRVARNADPALVAQFCLTYHQRQVTGQEAKKDLDRWLKVLRRVAPGVGYLWILEFQSRGVPHFHVWLTVPFERGLWKHLGAAWNRIAEADSAEHLWWHTEERLNTRTGKVERSMIDWEMKGAGYLRKYMSKEAQKCVPSGFGWVGRFWGHTRNLVPDPVEVEADSLPVPVTDITRTVSKWVEARRRRGAEVGRRIAEHRGREYHPVKLRPTVRATPTSGWLNNASPVLLELLSRLEV